jgi:hypothetical protein
MFTICQNLNISGRWKSLAPQNVHLMTSDEHFASVREVQPSTSLAALLRRGETLRRRLRAPIDLAAKPIRSSESTVQSLPRELGEAPRLLSEAAL